MVVAIFERPIHKPNKDFQEPSHRYKENEDHDLVFNFGTAALIGTNYAVSCGHNFVLLRDTYRLKGYTLVTAVFVLTDK